MSFSVNASITDFPLYVSIEKFFKEFKKAGADGVEIVGGYKNRWSFEKLFVLSKKYDLPIVSFHQPIWSGMGIYFDNFFFKKIVEAHVRKVTIHPLVFASFTSRAMRKYFENFITLQEKYGITIHLENVNNTNNFEYKKLFRGNGDLHLQDMYRVAQEYGFMCTFDISHAELTKPQKNRIFQKMLPSIGIIHLSSFSKHPHKHHLPLYQGDFDIKGLLTYLKKHTYAGELTLEINESMFKRIFLPFDFQSVAKSISLIREIEKKL